jgi:hypothetical protein
MPASAALPGADRARRVDAENWLLRAAMSPQTALAEWADQGVAVLTAGLMWDVVRVPYAVLDAAFDHATGPEELRRRLAEVKVTGAVFCDPYRPNLYVMVPPGTDKHWPNRSHPRDVECLGGTPPYIHHVAVPRLERATPPGPFWLLPPDRVPHRLADPQHLHEVLHARRGELDDLTP